jgi:putative radical SAM enzyme (TIGR03279 family)
MPTEKGARISTVVPNSLAEKSGFLPGDTLLSINAHPIRDPIDFMFYATSEKLDCTVKRRGEKVAIRAKRKGPSDFGLVLKPLKVKTCKNNCIFCFVKQLPRGLRKTLYIKDEDYRFSFLYGNYITLSNLTPEDKKRIIEQRLSPLYISVHTTNNALRKVLLGNSKSPDIMKELKCLSNHKIRFNVQIVLCPGYNDGEELKRTLSDLSRFYPYALSVAVVPIGMTRFKKHAIRPVEKSDAKKALEIIGSYQKRFKKKYGTSIVYGADELYLKADIPFPALKDYGNLHQIENGVGMVPLFLSQAKKAKLPRTFKRKNKFLTFTGVSFYPFLKSFTSRLLDREKLKTIDVVAVENKFFGTSVTVAGLLTGRDVIKTLLDKIEGHEIILVPDVALNEDNKFLDDITQDDMEAALGIPVKKISSTPEGLLKGLAQ